MPRARMKYIKVKGGIRLVCKCVIEWSMMCGLCVYRTKCKESQMFKSVLIKEEKITKK